MLTAAEQVNGLASQTESLVAVKGSKPFEKGTEKPAEVRGCSLTVGVATSV